MTTARPTPWERSERPHYAVIPEAVLYSGASAKARIVYEVVMGLSQGHPSRVFIVDDILEVMQRHLAPGERPPLALKAVRAGIMECVKRGWLTCSKQGRHGEWHIKPYFNPELTHVGFSGTPATVRTVQTTAARKKGTTPPERPETHQCVSLRKDGRPCTNMVPLDAEVCWQHAKFPVDLRHRVASSDPQGRKVQVNRTIPRAVTLNPHAGPIRERVAPSRGSEMDPQGVSSNTEQQRRGRNGESGANGVTDADAAVSLSTRVTGKSTGDASLTGASAGNNQGRISSDPETPGPTSGKQILAIGKAMSVRGWEWPRMLQEIEDITGCRLRGPADILKELSYEQVAAVLASLAATA